MISRRSIVTSSIVGATLGDRMMWRILAFGEQYEFLVVGQQNTDVTERGGQFVFLNEPTESATVMLGERAEYQAQQQLSADFSGYAIKVGIAADLTTDAAVYLQDCAVSFEGGVEFVAVHGESVQVNTIRNGSRKWRFCGKFGKESPKHIRNEKFAGLRAPPLRNLFRATGLGSSRGDFQRFCTSGPKTNFP